MSACRPWFSFKIRAYARDRGTRERRRDHAGRVTPDPAAVPDRRTIVRRAPPGSVKHVADRADQVDHFLRFAVHAVDPVADADIAAVAAQAVALGIADDDDPVVRVEIVAIADPVILAVALFLVGLLFRLAGRIERSRYLKGKLPLFRPKKPEFLAFSFIAEQTTNPPGR